MTGGSYAVSFVTILYLASSTWLWADLLRRWFQGIPCLPARRAATVPWQLLDLALIVFAYVSFHVWNTFLQQFWFKLPAGVSATELTADQRAIFMASSAMTTLLAVAAAVTWLRFARRASWHELGWRPKYWWRDLRLGLMGFLAVTPAIYAMQFVVTRWFPSSHPLIELLRRNPDPWFFLLSGFMAVIVAPVAEEFFFRVLLQGWIESLVVTRGRALFGSFSFAPPAPATAPLAAEPLVAEVSGPASPPYTGRATTIIPVLISSATFALAHYNHGPDPIPLFVLALALGWIYRRTRRLLPCIVIHALLNFCSLMMLVVYVYGKK